MARISIQVEVNMSKDDEILEVLKELAKSKGKMISLLLIYNTVVKKGVYTSKSSIHSALKRLEIRGKIKATNLGSIELLEV
jgi:Fe2+ or Zn2+ uptake regulation protein